MSKSISFQNGQGDEKHNRREEKVTGKQEHINKSRSDLNIKYVDRNIERVYKKIFNKSCKEYNAKARKNRRIENYYEKIKNDGKKKVSYECIVQVGKKSDTGSSSELEKKALDRFMRGWKKRNPHLFVYCAYMHNDEGTSHLHIDYIPVATNCTRGLKTQNSLTQALRQQGFQASGITDTEQMQWENSERLALEKICQELGIDAKANQGLCKIKYYDEKTGTVKIGTRKHLSTPEYQEAREEMLSDLQQEKSDLQVKVDELNNQIDELQEQKTTAEKEVQSLEEKSRDLKKEVAKFKKKNEESRKNLIDSIPPLVLKPYPPKPEPPTKPDFKNFYANNKEKKEDEKNWKQYESELKKYNNKTLLNWKRACDEVDKENAKTRSEWQSKYMTTENIQKAENQISIEYSQAKTYNKNAQLNYQKAEEERKKAEEEKEKAEQERIQQANNYQINLQQRIQEGMDKIAYERLGMSFNEVFEYAETKLKEEKQEEIYNFEDDFFVEFEE